MILSKKSVGGWVRVLFTNDLIKKTERAMGLIMVFFDIVPKKLLRSQMIKVFYGMEIPEMVERWFFVS